MSLLCNAHFTSIVAMITAISCYNGPRYDDSELYSRRMQTAFTRILMAPL